MALQLAQFQCGLNTLEDLDSRTLPTTPLILAPSLPRPFLPALPCPDAKMPWAPIVQCGPGLASPYLLGCTDVLPIPVSNLLDLTAGIPQ